MRDILSVCTVTLIGVYLHCPMKDRKNRILRIVMSDDDDIYDICKNYDMYIYIYMYIYVHISYSFIFLSHSCMFISYSFVFFWFYVVSFYIWLYVLYASV